MARKTYFLSFPWGFYECRWWRLQTLTALRSYRQDLAACTVNLRGQGKRDVLGMAERCLKPLGDLHCRVRWSGYVVTGTFCYLVSSWVEGFGWPSSPWCVCLLLPQRSFVGCATCSSRGTDSHQSGIHTVFLWVFSEYCGDKSRLKNPITAENRENFVFPTRKNALCCWRFGTGLSWKQEAEEMRTTWIKAEESFLVIPCEA